MSISFKRDSRGTNGIFWATVLLGNWLFASTAYGDAAADATRVQRLLDQARQAEVGRDTARQISLVREAVRLAPDVNLARWQLGQMKVGAAWVPIEDAQRSAAANPKLAEYRQLRTQYGDGLDAQAALARWCGKNGLVEEARFHWATVL